MSRLNDMTQKQHDEVARAWDEFVEADRAINVVAAVYHAMRAYLIQDMEALIVSDMVVARANAIVDVLDDSDDLSLMHRAALREMATTVKRVLAEHRTDKESGDDA